MLYHYKTMHREKENKNRINTLKWDYLTCEKSPSTLTKGERCHYLCLYLQFFAPSGTETWIFNLNITTAKKKLH